MSTADDQALFKEPPKRGPCPICFLRLPVNDSEISYQPCCGKFLCQGCCRAAVAAREPGDDILCPFCRYDILNSPSENKHIEEFKKRMEAGDAVAFLQMGHCYNRGGQGLQQDHVKANELFLRAGELGCAEGYRSVAFAYYNGDGVERDEKKAMYYYELAAMRGDVTSRHNLGMFEEHEGNMSRAVKHYMIAAGAGKDSSLKAIRDCFMNGNATKDEFEKALCAHKESKDEMWSSQREVAAAFDAAR